MVLPAARPITATKTLNDFGAKPRRKSMPRFVRSLLRARLALFGVVILATVLFAAVAAPVLAPHDPEKGDLRAAKTPPVFQDGGSSSYILGTDELGRDILSRVMYGSRISLLVGFLAVAIAGVLGISVGLIAGYHGGRADEVIMRLADIQLAFPTILAALTVMAVLGSGLGNLIIVLGITGWVAYARIVRGQVLSLREKEFVEAARACGAPTHRILALHIFPNVIAPVIVVASFAVASTILAEATLSFLGVGVPPAIPTWGGMVAAGRDTIQTGHWWMTVFPGLAIMFTVLGINVVGDWLHDYLDPRMRL